MAINLKDKLKELPEEQQEDIAQRAKILIETTINIMNDKYLFLARIGYESYSQASGNKNYLGLDMPTWQELPENIKNYWIVSAKAIIRNDYTWHKFTNEDE